MSLANMKRSEQHVNYVKFNRQLLIQDFLFFCDFFIISKLGIDLNQNLKNNLRFSISNLGGAYFLLTEKSTKT